VDRGVHKGIIHELRRRRVFNTVALYIVGAWVALQVVELALPGLNISDFAIRHAWIAVFLLFPLVLIFGWRYDITKNGIVRTPPAEAENGFDHSLRRADHAILAILAIIAMGIFYQLAVGILDAQYQESVEIVHEDVEPNTIAVLPLENLSGDPEQAFFVSGMQDTLIAGLSRISALKVTSKTSTMRYRETTESLPRIAAQLGVAKLIEGSVFRVDDKVRITVTLINALLDEHIWSQSFERNVRDVMLLQNEVASAIAQQVEVAIRPEEQNQFDSAKSIEPAAYEAFLKGQFHVQRFTPQDIQLAAQYFQQAVELDPDNALAHTGLSTLCAFQAQMGVIRPNVARERCLPAIMKALSLDDSLSDAHLAYAVHMTWLLYNWDEGEAAFRRAIELNPSSAYARLFYSHLLTLLGRLDEGTEQVQLALELDPLNPFVRGLYGVQLSMTGDVQGARTVIEEMLAANPGFGFGPGPLINFYHELGEKDKAIAQAAMVFRQLMGAPEVAEALEAAYAAGDYAGAWLAAAQALEERAKHTHVGPLAIGNAYELGGEAEKAIDWYETGYQITGPSVPYLGAMAISPEMRSNPRFIKLLRNVKLDYWADKYSQSSE